MLERLNFPITKKEAEKQGILYSSEKNYDAKFPSKLRDLRKEKGVTQAALAGTLGVSKSTVGLYETGDTLPDAKTLHDIAEYFAVSTDWLVGRAEHRTPSIEMRAICEKTGLSDRSISLLNQLMRQSNGSYLPPTLEKEIGEIRAMIKDDVAFGINEDDAMRFRDEDISHICKQAKFDAISILKVIDELLASENNYKILQNIWMFLHSAQGKHHFHLDILVNDDNDEGDGTIIQIPETDIDRLFLLNIEAALQRLRNSCKKEYIVSEIHTAPNE